MNILRLTLILTITVLLPGCAAIPFGIGLIPGAPAYISSLIGNGQSAYEMAVDERTSEQQMLDAIIEGHTQAELYKHKEIRATQITAHCYFGKLYLVGEYDSQEQLKQIYECVNKVKDKRAVISRLYLKEDQDEQNFFSKQAMYADIRTQLTADFEVTSSPIDVEIVQDDIILLGVISDKEERNRIMAHAFNTDGVNRVISYLYHQENAGPEPHIMTAEMIPSLSGIPSQGFKKKRIKFSPKNRAKTESPRPLVAVRNPDRGR
ncbi:MAG: BON domain-containing protein [Pseudodesulfovibrio sp.]|nr:BON domain-containing protein [Pseudodesulfovibrio sp.]